MAKTSAETAIELQSKFEFYFIALTFSILGLSIQTAPLGSDLATDAFELAGWLALFFSGIVGLLRGESVPVAYQIQSKITSVRRRRDEIGEARERWVDVQIPFVEGGKETVLSGKQAEEKFDSLIVTLEKQFKDTEDRIVRRYQVMKWAFLIGVGSLLIARATPLALSVAERLAHRLAT
jgi:hypothetical protein